jgi:nitrogen fixation-related uncharacterized protein
MDEQLRENLASRHQWLRLIYMILFVLVLQVAAVVMGALIALQFLWALITGQDNDHLRRFGHSFSTFIFEVLQFLTYNTERKPFPFSAWPEPPAKREEVASVGIVEPSAPEGKAAAGEDIVEETREVVDIVEHEEAEEEARKKSSDGSGTPGPAAP